MFWLYWYDLLWLSRLCIFFSKPGEPEQVVPVQPEHPRAVRPLGHAERPPAPYARPGGDDTYALPLEEGADPEAVQGVAAGDDLATKGARRHLGPAEAERLPERRGNARHH